MLPQTMLTLPEVEPESQEVDDAASIGSASSFDTAQFIADQHRQGRGRLVGGGTPGIAPPGSSPSSAAAANVLGGPPGQSTSKLWSVMVEEDPDDSGDEEFSSEFMACDSQPAAVASSPSDRLLGMKPASCFAGPPSLCSQGTGLSSIWEAEAPVGAPPAGGSGWGAFGPAFSQKVGPRTWLGADGSSISPGDWGNQCIAELDDDAQEVGAPPAQPQPQPTGGGVPPPPAGAWDNWDPSFRRSVWSYSETRTWSAKSYGYGQWHGGTGPTRLTRRLLRSDSHRAALQAAGPAAFQVPDHDPSLGPVRVNQNCPGECGGHNQFSWDCSNSAGRLCGECCPKLGGCWKHHG